MKRLFPILLLLCAGVFASAQVPRLNSFPSASATIFLDFDGHRVISPYWNGGMPFNATPAVLTTDNINRIFSQVSEDFRPFNLNITTDSAVYFAAPITRRQRIIITDNSSWYGMAGGVAYIESFRWGAEVPAFVFSNLLNNSPKNVSEAISHETGHTLGLNHQTRYDANCNFVNEYHSGTGAGEISWAPIMGNSYSRNLTLWHNGPNNWGCTTLQDELSIISSTANGFGFRSDDVGNTAATAANINFSGNSYGISGFINSTGDVDMYRLTLSRNGRFVLNAIPHNVSGGFQSANIDLQIALLSNTGAVLNTYNPTGSVMAIIDSNMNAGTYFLRVTNTSNVNTANYGMLGNYNLSGNFTGGSTLPVYSLQLSGETTNNQHQLSWKIIADEPISSVTIERSADGRTFNRLDEVSGNLQRFSHRPFETSVAYYRILVVTASQLKYYSNIVALKAVNPDSKYNLLTNLVNSNAIVVNSKGNFNWRLVDMNGRMLSTGRMVPGTNQIDAAQLSKGMYLLQVIDGNEISTEKLIRQ